MTFATAPFSSKPLADGVLSGTPTAAIVGSSTLSLVARGLLVTDTAISGVTTTYFEHPYRAVNIAGTTSASFDTWLRSPALSGSTTLVPRAGFRAQIASEATLGVQIWAVQPAVSNIAGTSTPVFAWRSDNYVSFTSAGFAYTNFAKSDTQPRRATFDASTIFRPKQRSFVDTVASFAGNTSFKPNLAYTEQSSYTAYGSSTLTGVPGATAVVQASSASSFVGVSAIQADTTVSSTTTFSATGTSTNRTDFALQGTAISSFSKLDFQPTRTRINTGTRFLPQHRSFASSVASSSGSSVFVPRLTAIFRASYAAQGSGVLVGYSAYGLRASFTAPTSSTLSFAGRNLHARNYSLTGSAVGSFASNYLYNTPLPTPNFDNVVFASHKSKDIFTGAQA